MSAPITLSLDRLLGGTSEETGRTPIFDATWYAAGAVNDGLEYRFPAGALAGMRYLVADMLLTGTEAGVFALELQAGDAIFRFHFSLLPQVSARMRVPLEAANMERWLYGREGAWLKPRASGSRVNLNDVDCLRLIVTMQGEEPTRWCMTPMLATPDEPLPLAQPVLPRGPLLDELGQSTKRNWPGKSRSIDEVVTRLNNQLLDAPLYLWPDGFSRWGGWQDKPFEATGFFHTRRDDERWWLVDPEGCAFWSAGQGGVRATVEANITGLGEALAWLPDQNDYEYSSIVRWDGQSIYVNFLQANLMRAFGPNAWPLSWATIALGELRRAGFNTVGGGSEWEYARDAAFPYVRALSPLADPQTPFAYRDLPDVFDPAFASDAAAFAEQLATTRDDPALIGYFLLDEPAWAFAGESPAVGMLYTAETSHSRLALADFLRERYGDEVGLSNGWGMSLTFDAVAQGRWQGGLPEVAHNDLADFSGLMVERYFTMLSEACRRVDPNHLNLGVRYNTVPPAWCLNAMRGFDVVSINCYQDRVPAADLQAMHEQVHLPVLIGAWHTGALDVGLPAAGMGPRVGDQAARGRAYRVYLENAAALPWCVGVHHFSFYDQPALGRFDGEAYNTGFYDICHRPYEELVAAARQAHQHIYPVALGVLPPFDDAPAYFSPFYF